MNDSVTNPHEQLKALCRFMTDYGTALLSAGATAHRICLNLDRIAAANEVRVDCSVMPARVMLTLWDADGAHSYTNVGKTRSIGINIRTNASLDALAHRMEREGLSVAEAQAELSRVVATPRLSAWIVTPLVGFANASFCHLFGGDPMAMLIVWVATVVGFALKTKLLRIHLDGRLVTLSSATVAAIISTSGYVMGWSRTPELALGTSVLFLVPGIPYINTLTDLLTDHHLGAMSRFVDALVTTICLALGLCLALLLTQIDYL